jgi:hypothetical protein
LGINLEEIGGPRQMVAQTRIAQFVDERAAEFARVDADNPARPLE